MTYAIFSDIHGNNFALQAALADAKTQGADEYILIGDYASRFPWGNDVVNTIRNLSPSHIIKGNGEGYFFDMKKSQGSMTDEQFKPLKWSYDTLSPDNLAYLLALPEAAKISKGGVDIYLAHSIDFFYHPAVIDLFHTMNYSAMMLSTPISHKEYLTRGKDALLAHPETLAAILALPRGVHLFGHNHLQFHMEYEGRIFINPGSCGMAADWNPTAAYTILTIKNSAWTIKERRVGYDYNKAAKGFITSGYNDYSQIWSEVTQQQMTTGKEYFGWFLEHLAKTRNHLNTSPTEIWQTAVETWQARG